MSTHVQIYKCHCPHFMTLQCADDLYPCQQCQLFASSSHSIRVSGRFNTRMIFIMPAVYLLFTYLSYHSIRTSRRSNMRMISQLKCTVHVYVLLSIISISIRISGPFNMRMINCIHASNICCLLLCFSIISFYPHIRTLQYADDLSTAMHYSCSRYICH